MKLTRSQGIALALLTLLWGINWPVMKSAVSVYPPMSFRALSMLFGVPCLALGLVFFKVPFTVPRRHWREVALLALTNMVVWHVCVMLALPGLTSGRAAILGYTMPVFSALWGMSLYGQRLQVRQAVGIIGAGAGVVLLLWHEVARLSGTPVSAAVLLFGTSIWALGTQQLRRTKIEVPTLAIAFWMTVIATIVVCAWSAATESARWALPSTGVVGAIGFNAVLVFGFCHAAWFSLARSLPPVASSVSVCMIPVVGLLSGAWWLGEALHWQDFVAIVMIALAIATVLWPARTADSMPLSEA